MPKAARDAVPQSTQATAARKGCSGVPVRCCDRGEDDVRLHAAEALEIQREPAQRLGGQVRHHNVGGGHELADNLAPLRAGRIERHRALVAIHDQEHRSHLIVAYRGNPPVLAAAQALDSYDVGAEIGEQRGTVRPGDVPSKIEDPNSSQDAVVQPVGFAHSVLPLSVVAGP